MPIRAVSPFADVRADHVRHRGDVAARGVGGPATTGRRAIDW